MKKKTIAVICAVLALTVTVALSKNSETISDFFSFSSNAQTTEQEPSGNSVVTAENNATKSTTPDYILFDMLFHLTKTLDRAAERLEAEGKSGRIWSEYFERHAGLSRQQANMLRNAADDFYRDVEPVHRRAGQIIAQQRDARANGQPPTPPPLELNALQQQRQAVALRHRDRLRDLVGSEVFERLRQLIQNQGNNTPPFDPTGLQMFRQQTNQPAINQKENKNNE